MTNWWRGCKIFTGWQHAMFDFTFSQWKLLIQKQVLHRNVCEPRTCPKISLGSDLDFPAKAFPSCRTMLLWRKRSARECRMAFVWNVQLAKNMFSCWVWGSCLVTAGKDDAIQSPFCANCKRQIPTGAIIEPRSSMCRRPRRFEPLLETSTCSKRRSLYGRFWRTLTCQMGQGQSQIQAQRWFRGCCQMPTTHVVSHKH